VSAFRFRQCSFAAISGLVVLMTCGCGGRAEVVPKLVPVTGKVLLNGQPIAGVSLNFVPRDQTKGTGAFGGTLPDGSYELMHRTREKGVEAGTYYVTFSRYAMPDGSPIPEGQNLADVGAKESLPPALVSPDPSFAKYVVTVKDGEPQAFDFDLPVKK
jgi:hypothetical protein